MVCFLSLTDDMIRMIYKMKLIEFFDKYLYLTIQEAIDEIENQIKDNVIFISRFLLFNND